MKIQHVALKNLISNINKITGTIGASLIPAFYGKKEYKRYQKHTGLTTPWSDEKIAATVKEADRLTAIYREQLPVWGWRSYKDIYEYSLLESDFIPEAWCYTWSKEGKLE